MSDAKGTRAIAIAPANDMQAATLEAVLLGGDLERLTAAERVNYMLSVCKSLSLNHLTKPFEFIRLNGKLVMYARKDCTEQLRRNRAISIRITAREMLGDVYVVTAQATDRSGRCDESTGAVPLKGLSGEALANAYMKAETKAKRRVTLSISGLGLLDESEVDSIPGAERVDVPAEPTRPAPAKRAPAPAKPSPPPSVVDERALRIQKLCLLKAPEGLGWSRPHAKNWLKKRFGKDMTTDLTDQQKADAELLILARMNSEAEYDDQVAKLARAGRCLGDGEVTE